MFKSQSISVDFWYGRAHLLLHQVLCGLQLLKESPLIGSCQLLHDSSSLIVPIGCSSASAQLMQSVALAPGLKRALGVQMVLGFKTDTGVGIGSRVGICTGVSSQESQGTQESVGLRHDDGD